MITLPLRYEAEFNDGPTTPPRTRSKSFRLPVACKDDAARRAACELTVDAYYNAIRPEANHETWLLKTKLTFQFPN